ncbi:MAG: pilus assembly protein TadG, partial [Sphingomonas sp.]
VPYNVFDGWHYGQINVPISRLKNGTLWNNSMNLAIGANGADRTINWDGCIEERQTVSQSSYSPIPSGAKDLNIDLVPSTGDATTQWKPALPDAIYLRKIFTSYSELDTADVAKTNDEYYNSVPYYCPTEAKKLQAWPVATDFDDYVDSLTPSGNTYHDIGMIWGARLASPTGIFASENALTPLGGEIDRHIIFMTDGDAQGASCDYSAYGVAFFDRRTTTSVGSASNCGNSNSAVIDQINARLDGLCTAVKNMRNTTLWVISFGSGSNTATETRLSNCATPGRYFTARSSSSLQSTFASIANQISQLRLTR